MSPFYTNRTRLTPFTHDDLPTMANWLSDFSLQRLVNPGMSLPLDEAHFLDPEGWFQADLNSPTSHVFAIRTQDDNLFIGSSAIVGLNSVTHCAEIGINLMHPDYRGKGYGREIMLATMRYGFMQLNLHKLKLHVMGFNTRAIRLYEKLGFQHEARKRAMIFRDGQLYDQLVMGMLRSEWRDYHGTV